MSDRERRAAARGLVEPLVGVRVEDAWSAARDSGASHPFTAFGRGDAREQLQAGLELIGPDSSGEALTVLCRALESTGLTDFSIALGSATLYPALLDEDHPLKAAEVTQAQLTSNLIGSF